MVDNTYVQEYFSPDSCPSSLENITPIELVEQLEEATAISDSLGQVLDSLVDGGSTAMLNYEVESSTPSEALQISDELIEKSPYLSDTVMKLSFRRRIGTTSLTPCSV